MAPSSLAVGISSRADAISFRFVPDDKLTNASKCASSPVRVTMESVYDLENPGELPPIDKMIRGRPTSWIGRPLTWLSDGEPVPVYITRFATAADGRYPEIFLFGARYDVADVLVGGESFRHGHFVEYLVVQRDEAGAWRLRRLLQRGDVAFAEDEDGSEVVPARDVRDPESLSLGQPPVWDVREAEWPTEGGSR